MNLSSGTALFLFALLATHLLGCTALQRRDHAAMQSSILSDLNPAPTSMAPPHVKSDVIDEVYLRSQADYYFTMGEAQSLEGNSSKAIEAFRLTLVYDPDSAHVRMRLATEFLRQGLISEAMEQAQAAVQADPSHEGARILLGGLFSTLKMYDLAIEQYTHVLIANPDSLEVPVYLGAVYAEQKRFDEAVKQFQSLTTRKDNPNPQHGHYLMGRLRLEQGDPQSLREAEAAFSKALQLDPKSEESALALSEVYEAQKKSDKALLMLASYQDKFGPKRRVGQKLAQTYLDQEAFDKALVQLEHLEGFEPGSVNIKTKIALILIEQKNYDRAVDKLEEILNLAPDSDRVRFYLGAVYEELKDPKKAIEQFMAVPASSQYYPDAVVHAAELERLNGQVDRAILHLKAGLKVRDDIPQFHAFYAALLEQKREFSTARRFLEDSLKQFPENPQIRFFLGSIYDRLGQGDQALLEMRRVIALDPKHAQAMNYLAYTLAEKGGDLEEADSLAQEALGISPGDGFILDTLGWVKFKKGEFQLAIQYLEAAHRARPNESVIAEHLGDAYYRVQLLDKARGMYLKAVSVEKDQEKVRALRNKLSATESQAGPEIIRTPASVPAPQE